MDRYVIRGGRALNGQVTISGSKNAALGIVSAAMLLDAPCVIENCPQVEDITAMFEICSHLGAEIKPTPDGAVAIDPRPIRTWHACHEKSRSIRGSYYLLGALLGRFHQASVYMPGGCNFGMRPIDQHIKGFAALGATAAKEHGRISLHAERLQGGPVYLDVVSVGATINIMIAAAKAEGTTVIENAAREPHIVDVANFLNTMGARIRGAGTDVIRITGVPHLPGGQSYSIIPDQIEAGTYMIAAALTRGDVKVANIIPRHMEPLSAKLQEVGADVEEGGDWIRVRADSSVPLSPSNFKTMPYPGFPTDLQPQTTVLLCTLNGTSRMTETVWDNRFQYVDELKIMGADILVAGRIAVVNGHPLSGARVTARDLRAGAAMVLAGLVADGETVVEEVDRIERGYEGFVTKLQNLGADICREKQS